MRVFTLTATMAIRNHKITLYLATFIILFQMLQASMVSFLNIDEILSEKYGLEISKTPVLRNKEQLNVVHIANKFGQMYQCDLPHVDELQSDLNKNETEENRRNISITDILDKRLKGKCLAYAKDWWTYKVCYKKSILQYHDNGSGKTPADTVVLGLYESEKNWSHVTNQTKLSSDLAFHSQKYTNGTVCDLTKLPRETIVKYRCMHDSADAIQTVEEPSTCTYIITIHLNSLCSHPLLATEKISTIKTINCAPALNEEQYTKYQNKVEKLEVEKAADNAQSSDSTSKENNEIDTLADNSIMKKIEVSHFRSGNDPLNEGENKPKLHVYKIDINKPESKSVNKNDDIQTTKKPTSKINQALSKLKNQWKKLEQQNEQLNKKEQELNLAMRRGILKTIKKTKGEMKELQKLLIKLLRKKRRKTISNKQKEILEQLVKKTKSTMKNVKKNLGDLEKKHKELKEEQVKEKPSTGFSKPMKFINFGGNQLDDTADEENDIALKKADGSGILIKKKLKEQQSLSDILDKINQVVSKVNPNKKSIKDTKDIGDEDSLMSDNENTDTNSELSVHGEKQEAKEIEKLMQEELATVGLNIGGGNVKVKIITDPAEISKYQNVKKMETVETQDMTDFKDLLMGLLGGSSSKRIEEERVIQMESNYEYVWNEEDTNDHDNLNL